MLIAGIVFQDRCFYRSFSHYWHEKLEGYRVSESKVIMLKHVSELKLFPSP